ncbi:MAG: hypothetical protein AAGA62_17620 [Bacteroidota bacterium]
MQRPLIFFVPLRFTLEKRLAVFIHPDDSKPLNLPSIMAEFCNTCAERIGTHPDFDVYRIHRRLKRGYYQVVLCEGCGMVAVLKEENGELKAGYPEREFIEWRTYWMGKDLV